jgi:hypothetical protein
MYTINLKRTVKFKFPYMNFKTKLNNIKAIKYIIGIALAKRMKIYKTKIMHRSCSDMSCHSRVY